jgi:hypothetical protein
VYAEMERALRGLVVRNLLLEEPCDVGLVVICLVLLEARGVLDELLELQSEDSEVVDEVLDFERIGSVHGYLLVANRV